MPSKNGVVEQKNGHASDRGKVQADAKGDRGHKSTIHDNDKHNRNKTPPRNMHVNGNSPSRVRGHSRSPTPPSTHPKNKSQSKAREHDRSSTPPTPKRGDRGHSQGDKSHSKDKPRNRSKSPPPLGNTNRNPGGRARSRSKTPPRETTKGKSQDQDHNRMHPRENTKGKPEKHDVRDKTPPRGSTKDRSHVRGRSKTPPPGNPKGKPEARRDRSRSKTPPRGNQKDKSLNSDRRGRSATPPGKNAKSSKSPSKGRDRSRSKSPPHQNKVPVVKGHTSQTNDHHDMKQNQKSHRQSDRSRSNSSASRGSSSSKGKHRTGSMPTPHTSKHHAQSTSPARGRRRSRSRSPEQNKLSKKTGGMKGTNGNRSPQRGQTTSNNNGKNSKGSKQAASRRSRSATPPPPGSKKKGPATTTKGKEKKVVHRQSVDVVVHHVIHDPRHGTRDDDGSRTPTPASHRRHPAEADSHRGGEADAVLHHIPRSRDSGGNRDDDGRRQRSRSLSPSGSGEDTRDSSSDETDGDRRGGAGRRNYGNKRLGTRHEPNYGPHQGRHRPHADAADARRQKNTTGPDDEETMRMLADGRLKVNKLTNKIEELNRSLDELKTENRDLRRQHKLMEKRLQYYEGRDSDQPTVLQRQAEELHAMGQKVRRNKEKCLQKEKELREKNDELERTQRLLRKMKGLVDDKKLAERDQLQRKLTSAETDLAEKDKRIKNLEAHINNLNKNHNHHFAAEKAKQQAASREAEELRLKLEELKTQAKERQKEAEMKGMYSSRKPPHRLNDSIGASSSAAPTDDYSSPRTKPPLDSDMQQKLNHGRVVPQASHRQETDDEDNYEEAAYGTGDHLDHGRERGKGGRLATKDKAATDEDDDDERDRLHPRDQLMAKLRSRYTPPPHKDDGYDDNETRFEAPPSQAGYVSQRDVTAARQEQLDPGYQPSHQRTGYSDRADAAVANSSLYDNRYNDAHRYDDYDQ